MAPPIDWREIARKAQDEYLRSQQQALAAQSVSALLPPEPAPYTGPTLRAANPQSSMSDEFIPKTDDEKRLLYGDPDESNVFEKFTGGLLKPFEQVAAVPYMLATGEQPPVSRAYDQPDYTLSTPEKWARGTGVVGGNILQFASALKGISGIGSKILGGSADEITRAIGPKIMAKELAEKELTKGAKKGAYKAVEKSVARRIALQQGIDEMIVGTALAGLQSQGDPVMTALGGVLGLLPPVVGNELAPIAKQGFNRAVTLGRQAIQKGKGALDDVVASDAYQTLAQPLANERGAISLGGGDEPVENLLKKGKENKFIGTVRDSERTVPEVAENLSGEYAPISNKETLKFAEDFVEQDFDEAVKIVKSNEPASAESNAIAQVLIDKLQKSGRFQEAIDIVEITAEKATTQGQAIQVLSLYNRLTPEGINKYATRQLDKARNALPKEKVAQVAQASNELATGFKQINKEAADQVATQIDEVIKAPPKVKPDIAPDPAEMLAQRLAQSTEAGAVEKAGPDPMRDMVNTLHKFGKEFLEKEGKTAPRDPLEFVKDALQNKDKYREVWTKAQQVVREKFKDQPKVLEELDQVLNVSGSVPFADNQLSQALQQELRNSKVNISELVREHYTKSEAVKKKLSEKLVERAGLNPELSQELEGFISNKFNEIAGQKKEQVLKQVFKQRFRKSLKPIDQKIIEFSNLGAFDKREYQNLVAQKLGLPAMDDELAKTLFEKSTAIQTMPEGRAKDVATAEMMKLISDRKPVSLAKKISSIQTMAQLLIPKAAIRNVGGNSGFLGSENLSDIVGTPIDKAVSLITGIRTKVLPSLKVQARGFKRGLKEGYEDAIKGIDTLPTVKTQYDIPRGGVFDGKVGKSLEKLLNIELKVPDRAFYQAAYDNSLDQQIRAAAKMGKAIKEPTEEMFEIAHHDALYRTFQDDSAGSYIFTKIKDGLNVGKEFGVGDIVVKYPKTPGNILSRGIAYSPAGFINTLYQATRPLMGRAFNQKKFVESFSRALVGTSGYVGMGALLHRLGIIIGSSKDFEIASIERDAGLGDNKINVSALKRFVLSGFDPETTKLEKEDTLVSYDWFQPAAIGIALGADLDKNKGRVGVGTASAIADATLAGIDSIAEMPLISGITRAFKQKSFGEGVKATLEAAPASFVPSILGQIRMMTDKPRETYDADFFKRTKNKVFAKVPFLSNKLPEQIDVFGNEQKFLQGEKSIPKKLFDVFLNPAWVTKYKPTPEAELVLNLYRDTGETKQAPRFVQKTQRYKGIDIELTPQQYNEMKRYVGTMTGERFRQLAEDDKFTEMAPEDQVDALSKELTTIGKVSNLKILGNQFKELAPDDLTEDLIKQDEANLQLSTRAEEIYEKLKTMDKEKANAATRQLKEKDRQLFDKLKHIREDDKIGLTLEDRKIKMLQVKNGFRANYIWRQIQDFSTKEEKNAYIKELEEKKIITKAVRKQLENLKAGKPYNYDD